MANDKSWVKLFEKLSDADLRTLGYNPDDFDFSEDDRKKWINAHGKEVARLASLKAGNSRKIHPSANYGDPRGRVIEFSEAEKKLICILSKLKQRRENNDMDILQKPETINQMLLQAIIDVCNGDYADFLIKTKLIEKADDIKDSAGGFWILSPWLCKYAEEKFWPKDRGDFPPKVTLGKIYKKYSKTWFKLFEEKRHARGVDNLGQNRRGTEYLLNPRLITNLSQATFEELEKAWDISMVEYEDQAKKRANTVETDKAPVGPVPALVAGSKEGTVSIKNESGKNWKILDISITPEGELKVHIER